MATFDFQIRYGRQIQLPEVGLSGQETLAKARVLVVGLGGLGSPVSISLAASGVTHLTLVDHDHVAWSNLHRQTLYGPEDVGKAKVAVALCRLKERTGAGEFRGVSERLSEANVASLVKSHDLVLDCSDNFKVRYLLGDSCRVFRVPLVTAALSRFSGQLAVFSGREGPCYRCLFPEPPRPRVIADCAQAGVLGSFAGLMGAMQAYEACKLLLGLPTLESKLLCVDGLSGEQRALPIPSNPSCKACALREQDLADVEWGGWPLSVPEERRDSSEDGSAQDWECDLPHVMDALVTHPMALLLDVRSEAEFDSFALPGAKLWSFATGAPIPEGLGEAPVFVYCQTGQRSQLAVTALRKRGVSAFSLSRGLSGLSSDALVALGKVVRTLLAEGFERTTRVLTDGGPNRGSVGAESSPPE